jgi:hypothetical protein
MPIYLYIDKYTSNYVNYDAKPNTITNIFRIQIFNLKLYMIDMNRSI